MNLTQKINDSLSHWLPTAEIIFLSLMIVFLPSLETPKNIFLVLFLLSSTLRQLTFNDYNWKQWDWIFFIYIGAALLSAIFSGITPGDEWRGFRGMLAWTSVGWLISRTNYSAKQFKLIFLTIILSAIPPTVIGLAQYLIIHSKGDLQLHSVGHVNHSAIYLCMILGASVGLNLSLWATSSLKRKAILCATSLFFLSSLIITESRAAVAVGILLCFFLILLLPIRKNIRATWLTALFLLVTLMFELNVGVVQKHFNSLNADSKYLTGGEKYIGQRSLVWNVSFEALRFNPFFGVGNGNWHRITEEDLKRSVEARGEIFNKDKYLTKVGHSHSIYLSAAVERGIFGFIALMIFAGGWVKLLIQTFKHCSDSPLARYLWAGSFSGWLTTFGIGLFNSTFHHEHAILAMLLLGLHISFSREITRINST